MKPRVVLTTEFIRLFLAPARVIRGMWGTLAAFTCSDIRSQGLPIYVDHGPPLHLGDGG